MSLRRSNRLDRLDLAQAAKLLEQMLTEEGGELTVPRAVTMEIGGADEQPGLKDACTITGELRYAVAPNGFN